MLREAKVLREENMVKEESRVGEMLKELEGEAERGCERGMW